MAISKGDARNKAREQKNEFIASLEKKIDKALVKDAKTGRMTTIAASGLSQMTISAIIDKYKSAGWKVTHVSDWRDGDYLSFE